MAADPREFCYKSPRVLGQVPTHYCGQVFYRVLSLANWRTSFWFKDFEKKTRLINERLTYREGSAPFYYGDWALEAGRIIDEDGNLLPEFSKPIRMEIKPGKKKPDWEILPIFPVISDRVKSLIEELEPGKAAFIPIDAVWPDGRTDRYHWCIWGRLSERVTDDVIPPGWLSPIGSDEQFRILESSRLADRNFVRASAYTIISRNMLDALGDVLLPQQVFVPFGIS